MAGDYYEILGIPRNASEADVKKPSRNPARQYPPDRNPGDKAAEAKFKEVQEAYAILGDKQKKAQYDTFGSAGGNPFAGGGNPFAGGANPFGGGAGAGFDPEVFNSTDLSELLRRMASGQGGA